jgi:prepilin-type N-terminal cleavage/methylation domain-containing protein
VKVGKAAGFTLVEVLVAIGIFAVVSAAIGSALTATVRSFSDRRSEAEAQQDRRTVNYVLARTLRSAGLDPFGTGNFGIEQALADRVTFSMDSNLNGVLDAGEQMTFVFDPANGSLTRLPGDGTLGSGSVVASGLSDLTFSYLASDDSDLGEPDQDADLLEEIRSIQVRIVAEVQRMGAKEAVERPVDLVIACLNL